MTHVILNRPGRLFAGALCLALGGLVLSACAADGTLTPRAQNVVNIVCSADPTAYTVGQVAGAMVPVPGVQVALGADATLVHPAVVAACAQYGMKPAAVAATPVVAVAAKP